MAGPRIGVALGSGAARGWSHLGVLSSLIEAGIEPERRLRHLDRRVRRRRLRRRAS